MSNNELLSRDPFLNKAVRTVLRLKHTSRRTKAPYPHYRLHFVRFRSKRHLGSDYHMDMDHFGLRSFRMP